MYSTTHEKDDSILNTVVQATRILDYLSEKKRGYAPSMIKDLGMTKGTLYRLLETLKSCGVVESDNHGMYLLTFKFFEIGNSVLYHDRLIDSARPEMLKLSEEVNRTVQLGIRFENEVLYLDKSESVDDLLLDQPVGSVNPLYSTATGKVLLAYMNDTERFAYYEEIQKTCSSNSQIEVSKLEIELDRVREKGYALLDSELYTELKCIAVPVRQGKKVIAALSICSPADRFSDEEMRDILPQLQYTAFLIGERIE